MGDRFLDDSAGDSGVSHGGEPALGSLEADWRAAFPALNREDAEAAPPLSVMLENPKIAGFLKEEAPVSAQTKIHGLAAGFAVLAATALIVWLGGWEVFQRYQPLGTEASAAPSRYLLSVPERYRRDVGDINALLDEGRFATAFETIGKLRQSLAEGEIKPELLPLREWANTELLALAPRMTPIPYEDAAVWYGELAAWAKERGDAHPSFRAMGAYAVLVENKGSVIDGTLLLGLVDAMRADYGPELDKNRTLLKIEAETHLAALPVWRQTEPDFTDHWRKINRAVSAFGLLAGETDEEYLLLDRKRWTAMRRCFRLPAYFNAGKTVKIGNSEITWEYVNERLEAIDAKLKTIRNRPGK